MQQPKNYYNLLTPKNREWMNLSCIFLEINELRIDLIHRLHLLGLIPAKEDLSS